MPSPRTCAPVLPVAISQSPLLSGAVLPDELFTTLAGPLPTITIGVCPPTSPRLAIGRAVPIRSPRHPKRTKPAAKHSLPCTPFTPSAPIPPKQVISLLNLLERMEIDVATEVQRVRLGIQETRMLVCACREDSKARESARGRVGRRGGGRTGVADDKLTPDPCVA